ncbi:iron-containing alcohol dehydrogenase [Paenibacillus xerothermodurans]|uniref:Iron-containing alcohol dehydrogenase n=1 Tax=Paenibacillus xerothermodurans TaxID=1977292 RepID=A0A2W1NW31_PAEXE|nr:iron-containing alcohol dehydrogenase [Paenibacillus xerothermodurans]PZE22743.1 iron-containing alcohol dehydrogenase [Paenibacillus xerothermodurans]
MRVSSTFRTPGVIITGIGSVQQVGGEAVKLGARQALVVTDKVLNATGLTARVTRPLEAQGITVDVIDEVVPEPPFENVERIARSIAGRDYDVLIGLGGGSALDVTKALAIMLTNPGDVRELIGIDKVRNKGIPFILIPTTAGTGSEVTYNAIFTDAKDDVKKGIVSPHLLPDVAIVDAELTVSVPPKVTAATGMDALVHAVESYTAGRATELTDGVALHAIQLISRSLRSAVYSGNNIAAREDMAMGSLMAGISLGNAGVGAVHALAYPLGGKFKVPHGVANSLLLPYVMKYNVIANLTKFANVANALGENTDGLSLRDAAEKAVQAMAKLSQDVGIPATLSDVGVTAADIALLAEEAGKIDRLLNNNPRWLTVKEIEAIYRAAYDGSHAAIV